MGVMSVGGMAVVLCALPVEYRAVRLLLTDLQERELPGGSMFEEGVLSGTPWRVAFGQLGEGNVGAGILAQQAMSSFDPDLILFVGVAGALKDDVLVGDVVVATRVGAYQGGKAAEDFLSRPRTWDADHRLEQRARHLVATGGWPPAGAIRVDGAAPEVHFKPIVAGDVVLASRDSPQYEQLRLHYNDAVAIEMEGVGLAQAAHVNKVAALVIRGISDTTGPDKQAFDAAGWQARAAKHAASFAAALLRSLPPDSRPRRSAASDAQGEDPSAITATPRMASWNRDCEEVVDLWPLPRTADADPYKAGVFRSIRAERYAKAGRRPPYVPRAGDEDLAAILSQESVVLVQGQSRAGKSRTAFEVAARVLGDFRFVVPCGREAILKLAAIRPPPWGEMPALIWLDDLERYVPKKRAKGLSIKLLNDWTGRGRQIVILATIRFDEYELLRGMSGDAGRKVRDVLNRFTPVTLPVEFDGPGEREAIAERYPDEAFRGGLAEHLAAVPELIGKFERGRSSDPRAQPADSVGHAIVQAAADWHRAGLGQPIGQGRLRMLSRSYFNRLWPLLPAAGDDFEAGLEWAIDPVARTAALLVQNPGKPGTFYVADPILDYIERRTGRQLLPDAWSNILLLSGLGPEEIPTKGADNRLTLRLEAERLLDIANAARSRHQIEIAKKIFELVSDESTPFFATWATLDLANLLTESGDPQAARTAFRRTFRKAIKSGNTKLILDTGHQFGSFLEDLGDIDGARAVYWEAISWGGHTRRHDNLLRVVRDCLAKATHRLLEDAYNSYRQAVESSNVDQAARMFLRVGELRRVLGDREGARTAFEAVADSHHPDQSPRAARRLGELLEDYQSSQLAFQKVIKSNHPEEAPRAAYELGLLFAGRGETESARTSFQQAFDSGHPKVKPRAAVALADDLIQQSRADEARTLYQVGIEYYKGMHQQAITTDDELAARKLAIELGILFAKLGDRENARSAFRQVWEPTYLPPAAAIDLGAILELEGQFEAAKVVYELAVDNGDPSAAAILERLLDTHPSGSSGELHDHD
jgi:nucleoside phosphorylase/tetratricopeptide (TPR) repeat protein